jgi:hypothetical protein
MPSTAQRFEADQQFTYRALQDARQYNTDTDPTGSRAEAIYARLAKASRLMYPWSTDGTPGQSRKAVEDLDEITSILTEKIGPASRREFSEQGRTRRHESKTTRQLDAEIDTALTRPRHDGTSSTDARPRSHATVKSTASLRWNPAVRGSGEVTAHSGFRAFVQPAGSGKWRWEVKPVGYETIDRSEAIGEGTANSKARAKAAASRVLLSQL